MAEEEIQGITAGESTLEVNTEGATETTGTDQDSVEVTALKAQLAEVETAKAKAENDKRAAEGRLRKDQDLATQFADLKAEMGDTTRATAATLKALAAGETEGLAQELQAIETQSAQGRATRTFAAGWNSLMDDMDVIVTGEDGEQVLDYNTVKGLEGWRTTVKEAFDRKDLAAIAATLGELSRFTHKARAATFDERLAEVRKEEQAAAKVQMEKAGIHDLSSGTGAGGAGGGDTRPLISRTARMAAGIGKLKKEGRDFAVNPSTT